MNTDSAKPEQDDCGDGSAKNRTLLIGLSILLGGSTVLVGIILAGVAAAWMYIGAHDHGGGHVATIDKLGSWAKICGVGFIALAISTISSVVYMRS